MASTSALAGETEVVLERAPSLYELARSAAGSSEARLGAIGGLIGLAGLGLLFAPNLIHLGMTWATDENYSHGFLVPLLSLYFANESARRGPIPRGGGIAVGLALLVAAILGRLATILVPIGIVADLSFVLGLAGLCALLAGGRALARFAFPLAFLAFMIPLPIALYSMLASPLQRNVSRVASVLLNAGGIPVLCQGNLMTLPGGVKMFVAEACSGMRQLTGFLALTTAVAYLSARPWWYRAVLVAASVPIAMAANVVRVVLTGAIMYHVDPRFALGSFHTAEGLLMMGLGLGLIGGLCAVLGWVAGPAVAVAPARSGRPVAGTGVRVGMPARLALLVGTLAVGVAAQVGLERAVDIPRLPLKRPLASLPLRLGSWVGRDVPVDPEIASKAQADEYLNRVYEDTRRPGRQLTLWINYSRLGLNLRHSPEVCLPSGGWEKLEARTEVFDIPRGDAPRKVTRLAYQQGEQVQGVGFWYYIFGEGSLEQLVRRLPITSRSSHGRATRGSGLTVEVFCPGEIDPGGEGLRDFAEALLAELEPMLPDDRAAYYNP